MEAQRLAVACRSGIPTRIPAVTLLNRLLAGVNRSERINRAISSPVTWVDEKSAIVDQRFGRRIGERSFFHELGGRPEKYISLSNATAYIWW